jgi:plasmid stabilization system protein ParE
MNLPVIILPEAESDLAEAKEWYEGKAKGFGDEFRQSIEDAFGRISRMPELHAIIFKGVRRSFLRRFPYAIFYLAEETRIVVIAVMHTHRNPLRWKKRV